MASEASTSTWCSRSQLVIFVLILLIIQLSRRGPEVPEKVSEVTNENAAVQQDEPRDRERPLSCPSANQPYRRLRQANFDPLTTMLEKIKRGDVAIWKNAFRSGEYGWRFKEYIPSEIEVAFRNEIGPFEKETSWAELVRRFREPAERLQREAAGRVIPNQAMDDIAALRGECRSFYSAVAKRDSKKMQKSCVGRSGPMNTTIFSRFVYEFACLSPPCDSGEAASLPFKVGALHTSYIEPLFGYMRHPKMFLSDGEDPDYANKEYMIVDKWALHHLHTRWRLDAEAERPAIFIDMGASTYFTGGGSASQNWFVGMSECMCVPFTRMHLWEGKSRKASIFWEQVPGFLLPQYQFYNRKLSSNHTSFHNPLNHLLAQASPGDVVVVKVDFDSPKVERSIIDTIMDIPDLYKFIDELYFEYHVPLGRMRSIWGKDVDPTATVAMALDVFTELRKRGVRAHSWV